MQTHTHTHTRTRTHAHAHGTTFFRMQAKMSHNNYGSAYASSYGSRYGGGGSSYGEGWNGSCRSRSGGRAGPSAWPPRQSPPGMGSAKTHRRQAQRSRSQARDREDAAKWRQHIAAMPPLPLAMIITNYLPPP